MRIWVIVLAAVLGLRHAVAPDHLAAVTTFTETTRASRRQGVWYGLRIAAGHSIGMLAEAGLILGLSMTLPPAWTTGITWASAMWLIFLAVWLIGDLVHDLRPRTGTGRIRSPGDASRWARMLKRPVTAWAIGMLFGIAVSPGDLAIFTVVARTHADPLTALGYLAVFLAAMFCGLGAVGGGMGWANARTTLRRTFQGLSGAAGVGVAIALLTGFFH